MLPTYSRVGQPRAKSFRGREKFLIALVFLTFCFVCFCGLFYLPEFGSSRVLNVYKQFQKAGPEMFIPAPPIDPPNHNHRHSEKHSALGGPGHVGDREKLFEKIKNELGDLNLDRPETQANQRKLEDNDDGGGGGGGGGEGGEQQDVDRAVVQPPIQVEDAKQRVQQQQQEQPKMEPVPIPKSDDSNVPVTERRNKVREVSVNPSLASLKTGSAESRIQIMG